MKKTIFDPIAVASIEPCKNLSATRIPQARLDSKDLFGTAREIVIEHAGDEYRLRLTRQGKLILTK
jgi:hemin uptake protein HemP